MGKTSGTPVVRSPAGDFWQRGEGLRQSFASGAAGNGARCAAHRSSGIMPAEGARTA